MDNKNVIFKTLDNTPRMLFWGIDEFLVMATPFFLGVILGSVLVMLSGFVLKKLYSRWSKRFPRGLLRHSIYWNLPTDALSKAGLFVKVPHSHIRDFFT